MSFIFTKALERILSGALNWAAADIRVALLNNTNTCLANRDSLTIAGIGTLGELAGAGYARVALAGKAVTQDNANDRAIFDANDVTWVAINAGTAAGVLVYLHVTNDADSIPLAFIDSGDFPLVTNGSNATIVWNAAGILQAQTA